MPYSTDPTRYSEEFWILLTVEDSAFPLVLGPLSVSEATSWRFKLHSFLNACRRAGDKAERAFKAEMDRYHRLSPQQQIAARKPEAPLSIVAAAQAQAFQQKYVCRVIEHGGEKASIELTRRLMTTVGQMLLDKIESEGINTGGGSNYSGDGDTAQAIKPKVDYDYNKENIYTDLHTKKEGEGD